jgi:hypothetical protein
MTKAYYFSIFGSTEKDPKNEKLLLVDRTVDAVEEFKNEEDYTRKLLYKNTFDKIKNTNTFALNDTVLYSPGIDLKFYQITKKDHAWIKISAKIFIPENYDEELPAIVATFHHKGETYKYCAYGIKKDKLKLNAWNTIEFDYLTPEVRTIEDNLKVYVWHRGKKQILLDDLVIYKYERK